MGFSGSVDVLKSKIEEKKKKIFRCDLGAVSVDSKSQVRMLINSICWNILVNKRHMN